MTKSGHFWTTYLPRLVNVVCERPLTLKWMSFYTYDENWSKLKWRPSWNFARLWKLSAKQNRANSVMISVANFCTFEAIEQTIFLTKLIFHVLPAKYKKIGIKRRVNLVFWYLQLDLPSITWIIDIRPINYCPALSQYTLSCNCCVGTLDL